MNIRYHVFGRLFSNFIAENQIEIVLFIVRNTRMYMMVNWLDDFSALNAYVPHNNFPLSKQFTSMYFSNLEQQATTSTEVLFGYNYYKTKISYPALISPLTFLLLHIFPAKRHSKRQFQMNNGQ